jgi:hypothetical protein
MSDDGRYIAFESFASDLVPTGGDTNGTWDTYVRDIQSGTTTRVSVDALGGETDGPSFVASVSDDGRYIAFDSDATDLVANDGPSRDLFVRDMQAGATRLMSTDRLNAPANGFSFNPALSGNGRWVAFYSQGVLVPNDTSIPDIYVRPVIAPTIATISPPTVARGSTTALTVTGEGYTPSTVVGFQYANGASVTSVVYVSPTELSVSVSASPGAQVGTRNVLVMDAGLGLDAYGSSLSAGWCFACLTIN